MFNNFYIWKRKRYNLIIKSLILELAEEFGVTDFCELPLLAIF